ncbi:MAG TPA: hypothetical protein P5026_09155 [Kiritimatiellia bacterium]|nr:hypothetical protein [Kiritimatiellia bacterium]
MVLMCGTFLVRAEEEQASCPLSFEVTADLYSAYVWRGMVLNDEPVLQPGASASLPLGGYGSVGVSVWGNMDLTDRNGCVHGGGLNELDYTLSYVIDTGPVSWEAGHIWYTFPVVNLGSTKEVYLSVSYNSEMVTPFASLTYDYDAVEGFYANVGLSKEWSLTDPLTLGAEVSLGAGDSDYMAYVGADNAGLMDFNVAVYASYSVTDNVSVGARLAWVSLVDRDARDAKAYWDKDLLWGGINFAVAF